MQTTPRFYPRVLNINVTIFINETVQTHAAQMCELSRFLVQIPNVTFKMQLYDGNIYSHT